MIKVALITNLIAPYRIPTYNRLAELTDLTVFFMSKTEANRSWQIASEQMRFTNQVLPGWNLFSRKRELSVHVNHGLWKRLRAGAFDCIVVNGYESPTYWSALLFAKLFKKKFIFWNGSTLLSSRVSNTAMNCLRKLFIRSADSFLTYGTLAKDFLIRHGAPADKIVVGCNTVDVAWFEREKNRLLPEREAIKQKLGLPRFNILFSGQLIERKGLPILLGAIKKLNRVDVGLLVVGDGEKRDEYVKLCQDKNICNIRFMGSRPVSELPTFYTIADVLVCPSSNEVWGLILNEALSCGLPVICSDQVGAGKDIVRNGINGYIYPSEDSDQLACLLEKIINNQTLQSQMGEQSRKIIQSCKPEHYADNLVKAVNLAICEKR